MNHIYRLVWNEVNRAWVAVAETVKGKGKSKGTVGARRVARGVPSGAGRQTILALSLALIGSPAFALDLNALPTAGRVTAGCATISQTANALTVQQTCARAALDWQSFNIGSSASVTFKQPDSSSVALNRISGNASEIYGKLTSNGQVFFTNPEGILFGRGAQVNVGGLLATMADASLLFGPFVNSYKRLDPDLFVATRSTWSGDSRNAACRVLLGVPAEAARVESRRPGADANPYLVAAGILAGGLHGLRHNLDPGPALRPGDDLAVSGGDLPVDLRASIAAFEASTLMREALGAPLVDAYLATRRAELAAFDRWWRTSVSEYELARYPQHI